MWDFSIFGRRLFSVSERTYNNRRCYYALTLSLLVVILYGYTNYRCVKPVPTSSVLSITKMDTRQDNPANMGVPEGYTDIEPDKLIFRAANPAFDLGSVTITNCYGESFTGRFGRKTSPGGYGNVETGESYTFPPESRITIPSPGNLTRGPFIVTVRDRRDKPIARFRVDRTGAYTPVFRLTITKWTGNPAHLMLEGVMGYEPLGRETYPGPTYG